MNIPDKILEDKTLSLAEKLVLAKIRNLSARKEGCTMKDTKIASRLGISIKTVRRCITKLHDLEYISVMDDENGRVMYYEAHERYGQNVQGSRDIMSKDRDKMSQDLDKMSKDRDKMSTPYMVEPEVEPREEPEVEVTTLKNSFSVLNTNHEELVKHLLKSPSKLTELLPIGSSEEIANSFADYWVGMGRDFSNTRQQRDWVKKSLPKWAEIEKPKNETSEIKKTIQEVWKKELSPSELKIVASRVGQGLGADEFRRLLLYSRRNIGGGNGKNPYFVFGDKFEKILEHSRA